MVSSKKIYIFDTNVLLSDFNSIFNFGNSDIYIPFKVLEELDKHKKRLDAVGAIARRVIKTLDSLREQGSLATGVRIKRNHGKFFAKEIPSNFLLPIGYDISNPDNHFLALALILKQENPRKEVVVISQDINLRIKCSSLSIKTQDYKQEHVISTKEELYTGFLDYPIDDDFIDDFYLGKEMFLGDSSLFPNQFLVLTSLNNNKKTALARWIGTDVPLKKVKDFSANAWGFIPKSIEQKFAMDLLMDPDVPLVSLVGIAGSGKTLTALAGGLVQLNNKTNMHSNYKKMIVSRPVMPMGKDIGYLPGDLMEKMEPWLAPIKDNLQFLLGNDEAMLSQYFDKKIIQVEAMTYIRGRSIQNAYMLMDEIQNTTRHEIKTVLTRVGNNTKIILTGDIQQIDNINLDATSNGLTYVVEKFKSSPLAGHITLLRGERSELATAAAELL